MNIPRAAPKCPATANMGWKIAIMFVGGGGLNSMSAFWGVGHVNELMTFIFGAKFIKKEVVN